MKIKLSLLILTAYLSCGIIKAQKNLSILSKFQAPQTNRVVTESFVVKGEYLRIFEMQHGTKKLTQGPYSGLEVMEKQQGFITVKNKEFLLRKNEIILEARADKILTEEYDHNKGGNVLRTYEISNDNLLPVGSLAFQFTEGSHYLMENGTVIVTDESEGYGTYATFFSNQFSELSIYKPFESGFSSANFAASGTKIIGLFTGVNREFKLAIFQAHSGRLLNEGFIDLTIDPQMIFSFNDNLLVYSSGNLICLDLMGKTLWKKDLILPNFDVFSDGGKSIYAFTDQELQSIDLNSGSIKWKKSYDALIPAGNKLSVSQIRRPISFVVSDDSKVNFVLSIAKRGSLLYSDIKQNSQFIRIDTTGNIEAQFKISDESKDIKVSKSIDGITIIRDFEILKYEK
jgi:hypothetical protein